MSWRRFAVLVRQLPDNSRTTAALIDEARDRPRPKRQPNQPMETVRWGQTEHLLADVRDLLMQLQHVVVSVAVAQGGKKPDSPPQPLPRPTDPKQAAYDTENRRKVAAFAELSRRAGFPSPN